MLEFFTSKKLKQHREEKAEKQRLEKEERTKAKGKGKEIDSTKSSPAISTSESSSSPDFVLETAEGMPILDKEDEKFLERLTSPSDSSPEGDDDDETPPPLPPRVKTPVIDLDSDSSSFASKDESNGKAKDSAKDSKEKSKDKPKGKDKDGEKPDPKPKHFTFITNLSRNMSLKRKPGDKSDDKHKSKKDQHLSVPPTSTPTASDPEQQAQKEETEMARVLEDLNLAASTDNKAFSLSRESAETVRKFTQVLKDLVNGVPTAYGDLVRLIEDRDGVLARSYEKLPKSLKKLVAQLPDKLTSSLAPELLAVAAEAQGLKVEEEAGKAGAKKLLSPGNLMELVTKPGAVVGLLKGIVNALKTRFPAFIGTNVLWSVAVFLLLSALWYCYKRGRETRLEKEAAEAADKAVGEPGVVVGEVEEADDGKGEASVSANGNKSVPLIEDVSSQPQLQMSQPAISVSAPVVEEANGKK